MVSKGRRVVLQKPSGDEGVGRGQRANKGILGGALGQLGVPAPGNGKTAEIGKVQLVGLEGGDDGVNLFSDIFKLGQASPVLDIGLDPLVNFSLGSFDWRVVLQHRSIGADNIVMKWIRRDSRRWSSLLRFRCSGFEMRVQSASRARRSWRGDEWLGFVHT